MPVEELRLHILERLQNDAIPVSQPKPRKFLRMVMEITETTGDGSLMTSVDIVYASLRKTMVEEGIESLESVDIELGCTDSSPAMMLLIFKFFYFPKEDQ